jgi:small acid-soluble spore protein H (minor)
MDLQRAKEIAASEETVDVSYYGVPVTIQRVEEGTATAVIFPIDRPQEEQTVPLDALSEEFEEPDIPFV